MSKEAKRVVACYCRVSTDSRAQESSFENQQSFFKDYIARSKNYTLYRIYPDRGISGTLLHREEFDKMLIDAGLDIEATKPKRVQIQTISDTGDHKPTYAIYKEYRVTPSDRLPKFKEILVRNTSRFARNVLITDILNKLLMKGVFVRFIDIDKTTERAEDMTFIQLFQTFDEMFSRDLSRKVKAGNERAVANKIVRSHPKLYGYRYIKRKSLHANNRLEAIPHEAEVVQKIFRLYAGCFKPGEPFIGCDFRCGQCEVERAVGLGRRAISRYLTENGIKNRQGKDFYITTVSKILVNEKYAGYVNTGKYDMGTVFNKNTYPKVRSNYLLEPAPDNIEPIISKELYDLCQVNRKERYDYVKATGLPSTSSKYGGLLVCGKCGSKYQHNTDRGIGFYMCGLKRRKGLSACTSANVSEKIVDTYIHRLADGALNVELYHDRQETVITIWAAISNRLAFIGRNRNPKKVEQLQAEKDRLDKRLSNFYLMLADEEAQDQDPTTLKRLIAETQVLLSETKEQIESYTKKPVAFIEESRVLLEYAYELIHELEARTDELSTRTYTPEEVLSLLESIVVYGETTAKGGKASEVFLKPTLKISEKVREIIIRKEEMDKIDYPEPPDLETMKLFSTSILKQQIDELSERLEALKLQYLK